MTKKYEGLYGIVCYAVFIAASLYVIAMLSGFILNEREPTDNIITALSIDVGLLLLFFIPHSVMARKSVKRYLLTIFSQSIERSTYVLVSSLLLFIMFWQWRSIEITLWKVTDPFYYWLIICLSLCGWLFVFISTFLIDHFELFGLRQTLQTLKSRPTKNQGFVTPWFYRYTRHPMYLGFVIAFGATPTMTLSHFLMALSMLLYIFIGIHFEEKDLVNELGEDYRQYQQRTPKLFPFKFK